MKSVVKEFLRKHALTLPEFRSLIGMAFVFVLRSTTCKLTHVVFVLVTMPTHTHSSESYKSTLVSFMRHRDSNESYSIHTVFSREELSSIIPQEIVAWMKLTAFGHSDAGDDDVPTCGRSSTLAFHKKALSYFMPNKHLGWNTVSLSGNPTRSPEINDLIKRVKRHEVRGEGVSSQTCTYPSRVSQPYWDGNQLRNI